jgi:hypothetical protein
MSLLFLAFANLCADILLLDFVQEPPESVGRGGWSEFSKLLAVSRLEYREFLTELGFGPFLGIPYVSVYHPSVGCFVERFFCYPNINLRGGVI